MIIKQNGFRVSVGRFASLILLLLLLFTIFAALVNLILFAASTPDNEIYALSFIMSVVFVFVFLLPAWLFLWMFPDIVLLKDGIQFQTFFLKEKTLRLSYGYHKHTSCDLVC
jgi:uncharacterized membrane protein YdbT with pleckstrin-like domain